jgi:hypothetical protein
MTQCPSSTPNSIIFSARIPWPCPKLSVFTGTDGYLKSVPKQISSIRKEFGGGSCYNKYKLYSKRFGRGQLLQQISYIQKEFGGGSRYIAARNCIKLAIGSHPGDKRNTMGVSGVLSLKLWAKSKGGNVLRALI